MQRLEDRVLQVQADFNDGIEHARRQVFPKSRPAYDYPHMMRAVHSSLSKKTTPALRQRVLRVIRVSRHLPTAFAHVGAVQRGMGLVLCRVASRWPEGSGRLLVEGILQRGAASDFRKNV